MPLEFKVPGGCDLENVDRFGGFNDQRLNKLYLEKVSEERILEALDAAFRRYAAERQTDELFDDFSVRFGCV